MDVKSRPLPALFVSTIVTAIMLAACAGPSATPAPTQAPTAAPTEVPTMAMAPTTSMGGNQEMGEHGDAEVPSQYEGLTNPHAGDTAASAEGKQIYDLRCAACHGAGGAGDGDRKSVV